MKICKALILMLLTVYILCSIGCKKVSESDIVGKWKYEIDLPEERSEVNGIEYGVIEIFGNRTFESRNIPSRIILGNMGHKGENLTGRGKWEIARVSKISGVSAINLHFLEVGGTSRDLWGTLCVSSPILFGKISLYSETDGADFYFFDKIDP